MEELTWIIHSKILILNIASKNIFGFDIVNLLDYKENLLF